MPRDNPGVRFNAGEETDDFGVSSHQLVCARDPHAPIRAVIAHKPERVASRPDLAWRDDPGLARLINDQLAPGSD